MAVAIIDEVERPGPDSTQVNHSSDEAGLATAFDEVFERPERRDRYSTDTLFYRNVFKPSNPTTRGILCLCRFIVETLSRQAQFLRLPSRRILSMAS